MHRFIATVLAAALLGLTACAASPLVVMPTDEDAQILMMLNERLTRSMIVDRDPGVVTALAAENLRVLAPGGLIEGKQAAIAGVDNWDAADVSLSGTEVVFHRNVAIVSGRLDIDGTMRPVGRWGPLKYLSTWVKDEDGWRLLSRSLTPCLDKLIEAGRC